MLRTLEKKYDGLICTARKEWERHFAVPIRPTRV